MPALAVVLGALLAACGPGAQTAHRPPAHPKAVTLRGALVQARATALIVQKGTGPSTVRVTFAPAATPIYAVTSATTSAIQPGSCVALRGEQDVAGTVAASALVVASSVDDTCPAGVEPLPPPPADPGPPRPTPSARASPPAASLPGPVALSGQVLSLGGHAVGIGGGQGDPRVVLLPPNVQVFFFEPSGPSALVVPSCVVARGTRSRRGIAAQRIVDWPPGTQC